MSTSTTTSKTTTVAVDAHAAKGWRKGSEWVVTVPGTPVFASGPTLTHARHDAGQQLATAAANATELPALVRDGDGSLWVFTPHADGYRATRLGADDKTSGCTTIGGGTPADAADAIVVHHAGAVRLV